jgi:ABC-2 type transport system ATP-binding protein
VAVIEMRDVRKRYGRTVALDLALVRDLPGVTGATRSGRQVVVTGRADFAGRVTRELARHHVLVADLRLEQRTLDDAYLALTGHSLDPDLEVSR